MILGGVNAVLCGIVLRPLGETAAFRGATYHLPAGAAEDGPRSRKPVWQNYALEYLPRVVRKLKSISGSREFSMLGWCLGALISTLYAALRPDDCLTNLILLTAPLDFTNKQAAVSCAGSTTSLSTPIELWIPSEMCQAR